MRTGRKSNGVKQPDGQQIRRIEDFLTFAGVRIRREVARPRHASLRRAVVARSCMRFNTNVVHSNMDKEAKALFRELALVKPLDIQDPFRPKWIIVPQHLAQRGPLASICSITRLGANPKAVGVAGSGWLARPNWVVTAGHVITDIAHSQGVPPQNARVQVVTGRDWHMASPVLRPADRVAVHPGWLQQRDEWDIALVRLQRNFAIPGGELLYTQPGAAFRTTDTHVCGFTAVGGTMRFMSAGGRISHNDGTFAWHTVDTDDGESGAPLLQAGVAVAVHKQGHGFGGRGAENAALELRRDVLIWLEEQMGADHVA